jgi:hypothetical protein
MKFMVRGGNLPDPTSHRNKLNSRETLIKNLHDPDMISGPCTDNHHLIVLLFLSQHPHILTYGLISETFKNIYHLVIRKAQYSVVRRFTRGRKRL